MATRQSSQLTDVTPVTAMFQGYDTFMSSGMNTAVSGGTGSAGAMLDASTPFAEIGTLKTS
jgi:hypothetical protein